MTDSHPHASHASTPRIQSVQPIAALPGGEIQIHGSGLGPVSNRIPIAMLGESAAGVLLSRDNRMVVRIPDEGESAALRVLRNGSQSNLVPIEVAQLIASGVHQVANPAVAADGTVYATFSGARGQETPVSVFRISPGADAEPFAREIPNATGLAIGPDGLLYVSSRQNGTIYQVTSSGNAEVYAEGMGVATGLTFDGAGNLYVGDRSGTIFKIAPDRQIFVFATLEPSVSAYHLAFGLDGTLYVTGPTPSSFDAVYAIDENGNSTVLYRGLGRPQGLALDIAGNVYVGASLGGRRGIVRLNLPTDSDSVVEPELVAAGGGIAGLAFQPNGNAIVATSSAVFSLALGVEGLRLF